MLIVSIGITISLYFFPFGRSIAYPLLLLSTLAHEMGHGIAALLVGGKFEEFHLYADASGVAYSSFLGGANRFQSAWTSAGGLVGPAFVGMLMFICGRNEKHNKLFLTVLGSGILLSVLLVVRNGFGMGFVSAVGFITLFIGVRSSKRIAQLFSYFIGVQLSLSVFSRGEYLFMEKAETTAGPMPSDVANMANALFLPYWFWGIVCGGLSIIFLLVGIRTTLKTEGS